MLTVRREQTQVLRPVVIPNVVAVIHYFTRGKWPPDHSFHHDPVLTHLAMTVRLGMPGHPQKDISVLIQHAAPSPCGIQIPGHRTGHRVGAWWAFTPCRPLDVVAGQICPHPVLRRSDSVPDRCQGRAGLSHRHHRGVMLLACTHWAVTCPCRVICHAHILGPGGNQ